MRLAALSLLLWAGGSAAEVERVVLLTRPGTLAETVVRLKAELKTVGFEVIEAPLELALDPGTLARLAIEHQAAAIIALDSRDPDPAVDVWVQDRLTGKTVIRTIAAGQTATPRLIALRAVDLLQASFLELTVRPPPEPLSAPVKALLPAAPEEAPARLVVQAGVGVAGQAGFEAAGALAINAHGRVSDRFWIGLVTFGPMIGGELRGAARASIQQFMFWADFQAHFAPAAWLELGIGAGTGPIFVSATAENGVTGSQWSVVLAGEGHATWWFSRRVGLRAGVAIAGALFPVRLLLQGAEVGRATSPLFAGTLGVAVRL